MPSNKDFKRLVRARMRKTGESYTAARASLLKKTAETAGTAVRQAAAPAFSPVAAVAAVADYARLAGMSDAAIKAKTGCTWERWVGALDAVQAHRWPHRTIAQYVHDRYQTNGWWAQTVTVGYERIRGLRDKGQRRSGHYETSKSRTLPVSLTRLYQAFSRPSVRNRWLPDVTLTVSSATPNKYLRLIWEDGTRVNAGFSSKARSKAQVAIQHEKLPSKAAAERMKGYWSERLDLLDALLAK